MAFDVPDALRDAILDDRCVAFVGAGFTAGVAPTWGDLLRGVAKQTRVEREVHELIGGDDSKPNNAMDYEMVGDLLRQELGDEEFERRVCELTGKLPKQGATQEQLEEAEARRRFLVNTPYHVVLTTNFDNWLQETPDLPDWGHLLQLPRRDWWAGYDLEKEYAFKPRVLKLHGDADEGAKKRVVLARRDYRQLVYGTPRYADFMRAMFSTKKVLFVGTSFTDAYLNELRAAVLHLLELEEGEPMGWAIMPSRSDARRRFFEQTEHLGLLEYDPDDPVHRGCSGWLEAIYRATAPGARLGSAVKGKRIVWVDARPRNNDYGFEILTRAGAKIDAILTSPDQLDEAKHRDADLVITQWGFDPARKAPPRGQLVLERTAKWGERPPVIVFASSQYGAVNRPAALRLGAYEYCWEWGALLSSMQRLFQG